MVFQSGGTITKFETRQPLTFSTGQKYITSKTRLDALLIKCSFCVIFYLPRFIYQCSTAYGKFSCTRVNRRGLNALQIITGSSTNQLAPPPIILLLQSPGPPHKVYLLSGFLANLQFQPPHADIMGHCINPIVIQTPSASPPRPDPRAKPGDAKSANTRSWPPAKLVRSFPVA